MPRKKHLHGKKQSTTSESDQEFESLKRMDGEDLFQYARKFFLVLITLAWSFINFLWPPLRILLVNIVEMFFMTERVTVSSDDMTCFDDDYIMVEESCLAKKTEVDSYIRRAVLQGKSYENVLHGVKLINKSLDFRETQYVKEKYVDACLTAFYDELDDHLNLIVKEIKLDQSSFSKHVSKFLDGCKSVNDVSIIFRKLRHTCLIVLCVQENLLTEKEIEIFIKKVKQKCVQKLSQTGNYFAVEKSFFDTLEDFFMSHFRNNEGPVFDNSVNLSADNSIIFQSFISFLVRSTDDRYQKLKLLLNDLGDASQCSEVFVKSVVQLLKESLLKPIPKYTTHRGKTIVEFKGHYVSLVDIVSEISVLNENSYDEVQVYANKLLVANNSLKWPGKNLVIMSPEILVKGSVVLDVSGKDGRNSFSDQKAGDGETSGHDGKPGKHGCPGESGGNVVIISNKIRNSDQMLIRSNGGDGQNGQDGGDGRDGTDGKDGTNMSDSDFERRFPKATDFFDNTPITEKTLKKNMDNIVTRYSTKDEEENRLHKCIKITHCTGSTEEGYEVDFCFYCKVNIGTGLLTFLGLPTTQSYCLVKGSDGMPGEKGGDGGCGGNEGLGGYSGSIIVLNMESRQPISVDKENYAGKDGNAGKPGRGGRGGKNGKKGIDHGRVDPNGSYRCARYYHGHLYLNTESSGGSETAWCEHKERHISIRYTSVSDTKQVDGNIGHVKQTTETQSSRIRKTAILTESIFEKYSTMFSSNFYAEVDVHEQLSGTLESLSSAISTTQRITENESQNVTLLVSSSLAGNSDGKSRLGPAGLVYIPSEFKPKVNNHKLDSPILMQSMNLHVAHLINNCNNASTLKEWMNVIDYLITCVESKSIKQDEDKSEIEAVMRRFLNKLKLFDMTEESISALLDYKKKWKSVMLKLCKHTWNKIDNVLTTKYRHALLNGMAEYVKNSIEREKNESNQSLFDGLLQYDLYTFVKDAQKAKKIADMKDIVERQQKHFDERIRNLLANPTLVNMVPYGTAGNVGKSLASTENAEKSMNVETHTTTSNMTWGDSEWKQSVCDLPEKVQKWLKMVRHIPDDDTNLLLDIVCSRLMAETLQIEDDIFQWLITRMISEHEVDGLCDFILLFATKPQNSWLAEYVFLQLRDKLEITSRNDLVLLEKNLIEKHCCHQILLLLSRELMVQGPDNLPQTCQIIEILELSQYIDIDDSITQQLQCVGICDWPYRFRWFLCLVEIGRFKTDRSWRDGEAFEAAYHLSQLKNKHGDALVESFLKILQPMSTVYISTLIAVLHKFDSNHWLFDTETIATIRIVPMEKWVNTLDDMFVQNRDRSANDLVSLMKYDSNNSKAVLGNLKNLLSIVSSINEFEKKPSQVLGTRKPITKFGLHHIRKWSKRILEKGDSSARAQYVKENIGEVIAVVNQAIRLLKKFSLRDTQKLSVAMFLESASGILLQVATGEGKSLIIATVAIVKALSGENVDVVTSSSVLAVRDANLYTELYGLFDVKVGHNSSELAVDRKTAYVNNDVVYGTIGDFQRDILLDEFYDKDVGIGSREPGSVIVDEVDSLLLDKGQNLLYLSHNLPCIDSLEPVYVYIWNFVHSKNGMCGSDKDKEYVKDRMIDAMYGMLTEDELKSRFPKIAQYIWKQLLQRRLIGSDGRILIRSDIENYGRSGKADGKLKEITKLEISSKDQEILLSYLKDKMRQGIMVEVPNYLKPFVDLHLSEWIESAFAAKLMVQNDHYVVDCDRSESATSTAPNVVIMDKDTGVEQYHSQWSNGLHQFLQLKHGAPLSFEGLKAVFISNVRFFSRYGLKLFGLTGTLGSTQERDLLKSIYDIEYATVPSFRPSRFTEEMTEVCHTEEDWLEKIVSSSKSVAGLRPVLIICESVRDVEKLQKRLATEPSLYVYKRSYEPLTVGTTDPIDRGCIILATNLAGRGTDIQISDKISLLGGMHVCLTYLPPNIRVEEQAFGRAGRKGQKGTGQLICIDTDNHSNQDDNYILDVVKMKMKRNIEEEEHIDQIKQNYQSVIMVEEGFFQQFHAAYKTVQNNGHESSMHQIGMLTPLPLNSVMPGGLQLVNNMVKGLSRSTNEGKELRHLVLQCCLDEWAFCLDKASHLQDIELKRNVVLEFVSRVNQSGQGIEACLELIQGPAQRIKLAKIYLKDKMYMTANRILDELIESDTTFSEIACYYKCHALATESGINSDSKKADFISHLQKTERLLKKRCQTLSCYGKVISMISEGYSKQRESFLFAEDYVKQKMDMINTLQVFLTSIQDMLGYALSPSMLQTANSDQLQTYHIYSILLDEELLVPATGCLNIESSVWSELQDKYGNYFSKIKPIIESHKNRPITSETFINVLPSREEFWQIIIDANLLIREEQFVILDKEKLESLENSCCSKTLKTIIQDMLDMQKNDGNKSLFLDIDTRNEEQLNTDTDTTKKPIAHKYQDKHVCLYPEQIEAIKTENVQVVTLKCFEEQFGELRHWKTLLDERILQVNRIAQMQYNPSVKLTKYDGIFSEVFTEIEGVNLVMSREIYECLKDITHDTLYMVEEKLDRYWQYQTEVENVIMKNFLYRKALEDMVSHCFTGLDSWPEEQLFEELQGLHIIKPVSVNHRLNNTQIENKMTELFGEKQFLDRITGDIDKAHESSNQAITSLVKNLKESDLVENSLEKVVFKLGSDSCTLMANTAEYHIKSKLRKQGKVTFRQLSQICNGQERELWQKLKSYSCIDALTENEAYVICGDEKLANMTDIPPAVRILLVSIATERDSSTITASNLNLWKCALEKYERATTNLTSLEKTVNPKKPSMEIAVCETNGFSDVVSLSEKKWTLWSCLRTGAIILMGLAQIAIGVLIEVYSAGFGTYVGSTLITEGCSDLIFAMECAISGHCSWESYFQHKLFSIKLTIATAGIGMVLSRGAKFSKFGYNFGRSHLKHLCGKELIKQVGLRQVAIAAAQRIAQKTIESAALGLANGVIDNYVNQKLGDFYRKLSGSILGANEKNIKSSDLKEKIKALSQKVGATKARQILSQLMSECLHGGAMSSIMEAIGQVGRALSTGFGLAVKKMGKCGRTANAVIAKLASWLPMILNLSKHIATINKIVSTAVSVTKSLISKVEEKINQTDSVNKVEDTPEDEAQLCDDMMNNWTEQMTAKVESVLSEDIGKPLLKQGAQKLIFYVGTQLKNQYTKYQNQQRRAEFAALKSEYVNAKENIPYEVDESEQGKLDKSYQKALLDLLNRTKDPLLFADIMRAGVPLGIHCVQAIAELSGRPIVINVCGDGDKITMPSEFTPCCRVLDNADPICVNYIPGDGDSCGHFFSPQSGDQTAFSSGHDCLLDAVSYQLDAPLDREQLACEIEVNPEIRAGIEQGIHKYLNQAGGAPRPPSKIKALEEKMEDIRQNRIEPNKKTQQSLMDRPVKENGAMHGTGNHEILQRSKLEEWTERSKDQPPGRDMEGNPYDHLDLVNYLRVDTKFIIWKGKDGTLQGHDGALYNEENGKRVGGRNLFHQAGKAAIMKTESAGQAAGVALSVQITSIISPGELKRMTRNELKNTFTAHGHNLAISRQKMHFCKGYEREYYKIYLVAKKFNAPNLPSYNPPGWLTRDSQMNIIKNEIDNARSIKDFGNVLMKPAPFG